MHPSELLCKITNNYLVVPTKTCPTQIIAEARFIYFTQALRLKALDKDVCHIIVRIKETKWGKSTLVDMNWVEAGRKVGASGFEPPTSASRTLRADQAALRPVAQ